MRGLCHVFSWLTQCNQAFPLADCSEENPVPYRAGNRDHRVTDGTQNRACNRGNTDALRRVKYPVHRTGKLFTGLRPDRFRAQFVLQAGHQGTGGMVGKCCHERTDQRIQFPAAYSALFDHGLASKSDQRFASIRSTGNLTFSTAF